MSLFLKDELNFDGKRDNRKQGPCKIRKGAHNTEPREKKHMSQCIFFSVIVDI